MSLTSDGVPFTMPVTPAYSGGSNGGNGMWGGDGWWVIVLFLIWGMWGGNWGNGGFGGGGSAATQGALTREQACIDNNFNNLMRETAGISDAVNLGFANLNSTICNFAYENAGLINGLSNTVQSGFNATQAQLAQCCCDQRAATADLKYTIANEDCQTRNLIQSTATAMMTNANDNTRAIIDKLNQQEMAAKDAQIAAQNQKLFGLELAASQSAQNAYLLQQLRPFPVASYNVPNPYTGTYGYAYGCGCNSGCGC